MQSSTHTLPPTHSPPHPAADVVWEHLMSVDGDTALVDAQFRPFQHHTDATAGGAAAAGAGQSGVDAEWAAATAAAAAATGALGVGGSVASGWAGGGLRVIACRTIPLCLGSALSPDPLLITTHNPQN